MHTHNRQTKIFQLCYAARSFLFHTSPNRCDGKTHRTKAIKLKFRRECEQSFFPLLLSHSNEWHFDLIEMKNSKEDGKFNECEKIKKNLINE